MKKIVGCFLLFCLAVLRGVGVPAYPGLLVHTQPDGSAVTYRLYGDEHCHAMVSQDGRLLKLSSDGWLTYDESQPDFDFGKYYEEHAGMSRVKGGLDIDGFPTIGAVRGLVLLVEFSDNSFYEEHTRELYQLAMNEEGFSLDGATGSARDYFIDQSMGLFTPEYDVYGPIKLSNPIEYYGKNNSRGDDTRAHLMISQACTLAHDSLEVDFSQYDFDDDGYLDFVYVIYAGYGENYGAPSYTIWPHASQLSNYLNFVLDGKRVDRYACSSELQNTIGHQREGIGTFCHEFSHVLGLPDMYNTNPGGRTQLGPWDIMDSGCYNNSSNTPPSYSAFERASVGWLTFEDLEMPSDEIILPELTENNVAYRIRTVYEDEYFTLENRQQRGWDAYQPGKGLMIIHIDYNETVWRNNKVNAGTHPRYDLVEANGRQGSSMSNNLYPIAGNNMFTDYSSPNSLAWDGTETEKSVTDISVEDGVVKFRFMRDRLKQPILNDASDIGATSALLSWQPVFDATSYTLNVREELPDSLNPIILDEDFSLMVKGSKPSADSNDISNILDMYTHTPGWSGSKVYQAGGYVKLGAFGVNGRLTTPDIGNGEDGDSLFVAFHVASYTGKSVKYSVTLQDDESAEPLSFDKEATDEEKEVILKFDAKPKSGRITFETDKERIFINDIRILSDTLNGIWTAGPKEWQIDGIEETSYLMSGLVPNRTYWYMVRAHGDNGIKDSEYSEENMFTTLSETEGIEESVSDDKIKAVRWYDVSGRRVQPGSHGLLIQQVIYDDGHQQTRKVVVRR